MQGPAVVYPPSALNTCCCFAIKMTSKEYFVYLLALGSIRKPLKLLLPVSFHHLSDFLGNETVYRLLADYFYDVNLF